MVQTLAGQWFPQFQHYATASSYHLRQIEPDTLTGLQLFQA